MVLLLAGLPETGAAQATGSLEGRVFDAQTLKPLEGAKVAVLGQRGHTRTDDSGYYHLRPLPTGSLDLRIERDGYAAAIEPVEVVEGASADFVLFPAATVLEAIVVKGRSTGGSEDGAKSASIRTGDTRPAGPASNLMGRVPGAVVFQGGQLGSGTTIMLRGLKSLVAATDPIIYLDGVRVSGGGASPLFRRYTEPSVLDLLDPASIERIEVLPGPAAATLYGTGAANGVILIYTK